MSVRDTIADEIEPAVAVYAPELADAIIARLEASGRSIVHKDEIHAPSVERDDAFEQVAKWHDKHSRSAREIADDIRVGPEIQAKALVAANHHAASAAAIRNKMADERRAARELMKEVGRG